MKTSYFYNSLTINERTKENFHPDNKINLDLAKNFWENILEIDTTKEIKNINDLLDNYYNTDMSFLEEHFESDKNIETFIKSEWLNQSNKIVRFLKNDNHEVDEEFEQIDFSSVPFYPFFKPFVNEFYYEFISKELKQITKNFTYACTNDILKHFIDLLYEVCHKTLILEINSLRLSNELSGDTSEERYQSFNKMLENDNNYLTNLSHEYPVLFRLIFTKIANYKYFLSELFSRYEQDKFIINQELKVDLESKISRVHLGSGDTHKQGRTVSIIELENEQKIVYKPRSLSVDEEFQTFIQWLNQNKVNKNKLKTIKIINKNSYGWSEFVSYKDCNDKHQVSRFYDRVGQLLGVLHILNATDFHYENLISDEEYPVLIDLESLFHHTASSNHKPTKSSVVNKSLQLINDSVISTGLIPNRTIKSQDNMNFDLSGIGNSLDNQELPFKSDFVSKQYTDEVSIGKKNSILVPGKNNPQINGEKIEIGDYLDDIVKGFSTSYNFFLNNKSDLKKRINSFSGKETRKIFRDTMKYWKLMNLSYHPDFMRNQIDRELLLNRLRVKKGETIERAVSYEIEDILHGDIPYFVSYPESKKVITSNGEILDNFYFKDGLSLSLEKINRLEEEDLQNQINIIKATISAVYNEKDIKLLNFKENKNTFKNNEKLLIKSEEIANILIDSAIKSEEKGQLEFCWTSMVTKGGNETNWVYSITGPGLYDGNPGIAMYFSYLYKITGKEKYKKAAYATINPILKILPDLVEPKNVNLGGYLGIGGIVYALHHIGNTLNDSILKDMALKYASSFEKFIAQDTVYDLIGGSSGALMVLMNLYEEKKESWMLQLGKKLADHLANNIKVQEDGLAWIPFNDLNNDPYIGFSHGNAGIIAALSRFNKYNPSENIKEIILNGLKYENSFYSSEKKNWYSKHLDKYLLAWCHGGPGILLSRCIMKENGIYNEEVAENIQASFSSAIGSSTGKNYSLCHGDLGLIDILMVAEKKLSLSGSDKSLQINSLKNDIIESLFSNKPVQADINSVGLLNGIASIGYGLLRIFDSELVPSVLILDKPKN